ncbi:MAG: helix-turn-helix domain-containing protein [Proteobacteria bacterium]|nr:helix-turn-helix domain-containing protein [Pseudomonadota bacterium]
MSSKREIFGEIMEGIDAMHLHREGKITLRSFQVESKPIPPVTSDTIRNTRKQLNLSRGVFARCLRISPRTLEKWEQGRSKPNQQASALILLVRKYPETLQRLAEL